MRTPLEQFKINKIIEINKDKGLIDLTINNNTIYLIISIIFIISIMRIILNNNIIGKDSRTIIIKGYKIIETMVKDIIPKEYKNYIPIILGIFIFVLMNNTMGLIPYSFTITSHIIITITMSLTIIITLTLIGFIKHKLGFFKLFIPSGLSEGNIKYIIPFIFIIEIFSYLIRIISLSVRLTANIISGHTLLKIASNFSFGGLLNILKFNLLGKIFILPFIIIIPILLLSGIYILEIGVAIIQSYVFTLLTILYIKDSESLH